jgi:hypothetical protein
MSEISQFMKPWKVRAIKALPDNKGVEIEFGTEGREPIRFRTRKFGIGRRNAKSAALAKFSAQAGFGKPRLLFRYLSILPRDQVGNIFPAGPVGLGIDLFPTGLDC